MKMRRVQRHCDRRRPIGLRDALSIQPLPARRPFPRIATARSEAFAVGRIAHATHRGRRCHCPYRVRRHGAGAQLPAEHAPATRSAQPPAGYQSQLEPSSSRSAAAPSIESVVKNITIPFVRRIDDERPVRSASTFRTGDLRAAQALAQHGRRSRVPGTARRCPQVLSEGSMTVGQLLAQDGVLAPELLGRLEGHFEGPQLTAHKRISLHGRGFSHPAGATPPPAP